MKFIIKRRFSTINLQEKAKFYHENGYAILENFISHENVNKIQKQIEVLAQQSFEQHQRSFFITDSERGLDFLQSGVKSLIQDKIQNFYEPNVYDEQGNLKYPLLQSLNKVGHNMHDLDPIFREFSYQKKFQDVLKAISYKNPALVQSMYIFKSQQIGQKVEAHTDNTYLITNPLSTMGVWMAIDDSTINNACLWGIPKSHRTQTTKFFKRNQQGVATELLYSEGEQKIINEEGGVPLEAPKGIFSQLGTVILLHGDFVHYSHDNFSGRQRHAYTMHFVEQENVEWDPKNWIQRVEMPFRNYYEHQSTQV